VGQVDADAIRTAATAVEEVAGTVRRSIPDQVGQITDALAGSASATAGTALATAWTDAYLGWATRAETHAQSLRSSAAAWTATDAAVMAKFHARLGGMRAV
jgi:type IV secretory pathway TrbL component